MNIRKYILVVLIALIGTSSYGQDILKQIVERGEIRIGVSGEQPPFSIKNTKGELIGFDIELATLLASSMRVQLKLVEKPFNELLGSLEQGEVDAVISGMTITPQRNLQAAFVGPYLVSGKSFLTRSEVLAMATGPQDIESGLKVVTLRGSTSEEFVREFFPNVALSTVDVLGEGIMQVQDETVDIMVADYPTCAFAILQSQTSDLLMLEQPLTIEPIGIALPVEDNLFINLVENHLESLKVSGILSKMEEKWFQNPYWLLQLE